MKAFFLGRALREKVLLLAFTALALLIWAGRVTGLGRTWWSDLRITKSELATQQLWLKNSPAIETQTASAAKSLDPAKTINATRLVGELTALVSSAGLNADIGSQRTERTSQFAFHSVQVNVRRADLAALLNFYTELSHRAPYIGLEQFSLATDRASPGQLNASFRVVSVELGPVK
jgi:hypothetical protein